MSDPGIGKAAIVRHVQPMSHTSAFNRSETVFVDGAQQRGFYAAALAWLGDGYVYEIAVESSRLGESMFGSEREGTRCLGFGY